MLLATDVVAAKCSDSLVYQVNMLMFINQPWIVKMDINAPRRPEDHWPGSRIPEAMHSMTRRRASPGPSGRLQVAMAFSQISSRGCRRRTERHLTRNELIHIGQTSRVHPPILWEAATLEVCCTRLWGSSAPRRTTWGRWLWPEGRNRHLLTNNMWPRHFADSEAWDTDLMWQCWTVLMQSLDSGG